MEKTFVIYDSDVFYTTRFMEFFKKNNTAFEIAAFTRKDTLEEYLQLHTVEILLLGDSLEEEWLKLQKIGYLYYLTDYVTGNINNDSTLVYKYQAAGSVMDQIMTDYARKLSKSKNDRKPFDHMQIISIVSPVPCLESLLFTYSLSMLLSEQNKVLLVLLDPLPVRLTEYFYDQAQSLSDFIYYLKGKADIAAKLNMISGIRGNLSYLSGILHGADLMALGEEDIRRWMEELRKAAVYQTVIFYVGCYTEALTEIMNNSDTVLITKMDHPYDTAVYQEWKRQQEQLRTDIDTDKFCLLELSREEGIEALPLTLQELTDTLSWENAKNYLNQ